MSWTLVGLSIMNPQNVLIWVYCYSSFTWLLELVGINMKWSHYLAWLYTIVECFYYPFYCEYTFLLLKYFEMWAIFCLITWMGLRGWAVMHTVHFHSLLCVRAWLAIDKIAPDLQMFSVYTTHQLDKFGDHESVGFQSCAYSYANSPPMIPSQHHLVMFLSQWRKRIG
jgi:hypothetical protein